MTDLTKTPPAAPTDDERRAALTKALRRYRGDGYSVTLSGDGLSATLTRPRRVRAWIVALLTLFTLIGGIIYVVNTRGKTDSVVLFVDERAKVVRS
jgi:DNA-binding transcriptional MocR family regulator